MNITVLGGDGRNLRLIDLLSKDNHRLKVFGFNKEELQDLIISDDLKSAIKDSDIVLGPIPCVKNHKYLNTPLYSQKIEIIDVFKSMGKEQLFIAGSIPAEVSELASTFEISTMDLLDREEMVVLNAIPTAEGAIQLAMEEMDTTLNGSNVLVLGFGRIGKILSKMLQGIGTNPYVEARIHSDLAWIESYGYKPIHLEEISSYLPKIDLLFNTIPHMILNEEMLLKLNKNCLIIDLASAPGGVDLEKAKEMDIKTIWGLGLPGKVAPITAANIIKSTINNIIDELEEL